MFKTTIVFKGQERPVSFFEDDTIDVVRQQISKSVDIHHDRLFALVAIKLPKTYYKQDPRNWETLFHRISFNGTPIEREQFNSYCTEYRNLPPIRYERLDLEEWMQYPDFLSELFDLDDDFIEYRILGVDSLKSYTLPFTINQSIGAKIPSAQFPIPENGKLLVSFYNVDTIKHIRIQDFQEGYEGAYFPLYTTVTPSRISEEQIMLLDRNSKHLTDLINLDPPVPTSTHILKVSWRARLVDTQFGEAVRTRFEQIFYGITLSENVPCVTFFTSRTEISRHKFYKETAQTKKPFLNMPIWSNWWSKSKPSRDRYPTLILYRGKDRENFDRISILPHEILFVVYRDNKNVKSIDVLKKSILQWFQEFDAVIPFIQPSDIIPCRLELQSDIKFEVMYSKSLDEFDRRRMNCLSTIFDESRSHPTRFRFLRADDVNDEISPRDLKIINMLKDDPFTTVANVEEELKITTNEASELLQAIQQQIEENPGLLNRAYRKFPFLEMKPKSVVVYYVDNVERYLMYTNILRYILSNPCSKDVDKICPKRMEVIEPTIVTATTDIIADDEFADLFGYLEGPVEEQKETKTGSIKVPKKNSLYRYFYGQLQQFDAETFDPSSNYPKICELSHQPVILSDDDIQEMLKKGDEFNLDVYPDKKKLEVNDPHGIVLCPDYWCMYDKIPLQESQLKVIDGEKTCPICHGKIRELSDTKSDTREFSVIKRKKGQSYPGFKDDISPKNQRNLPCCFKSANERKLVDVKDGKYYIVGETKTDLDLLRFAYLPAGILNSLYIKETYAIAKKSSNRIATGMSGFFRVGLKRPSEGLPSILNIDKAIPSPRHAISSILRCTFLATWQKTCDKHVSEIEKKLTMEPFKSCNITKDHMARTISSIDEAYTNGELTKLQELEYCSVVLKISIFRINMDNMSIMCNFYSIQTIARLNGIIILQRGNDIDCISHITRLQKKFIYKSNIYEKPFDENTYKELEDKQELACKSEIPTIEYIVHFAVELLGNSDFQIILDPFGRGQALYYPGKFILPYKNVPVADIPQQKIQGYSDIKELPSYSDMRSILQKAQKDVPGYKWIEDMYNSKGEKVEILTACGLRIPVKPEAGEGETSEVTQTIQTESETQLVLGKPNEEDVNMYKSISYASELYEFLIFQLTKDIQDDFIDLKAVLSEPNPRRSELEPELEKWFDQATYFISSSEPIEFLSKIRKPCGQFTKKDVCNSGHMCAWDGKQCKIQVRDTLSKGKLFNKLLSTLMSNNKIKSMILDGRTTPFFSTMLYIELPTEIIFTDIDLKQYSETTSLSE